MNLSTMPILVYRKKPRRPPFDPPHQDQKWCRFWDILSLWYICGSPPDPSTSEWKWKNNKLGLSRIRYTYTVTYKLCVYSHLLWFCLQCCHASMQVLTLARFILESSLMHSQFMEIRDSLLASSTLLLAFKMMKTGTWVSPWKTLFPRLTHRFLE